MKPTPRHTCSASRTCAPCCPTILPPHSKYSHARREGWRTRAPVPKSVPLSQDRLSQGAGLFHAAARLDAFNYLSLETVSGQRRAHSQLPIEADHGAPSSGRTSTVACSVFGSISYSLHTRKNPADLAPGSDPATRCRLAGVHGPGHAGHASNPTPVLTPGVPEDAT